MPRSALLSERVQYIRRRDIQRQSAVGNEKDYTVVHNIRIELGDGRTARLGLAEKETVARHPVTLQRRRPGPSVNRGA